MSSLDVTSKANCYFELVVKMVVANRIMFDRRPLFKNIKKVVVKLGTRVLTKSDNTLDNKVIEGIAFDIVTLLDRGIWVCIVSSGAIASGMGCLGLKNRPRSIPELQAAAAVGQNELMHNYKLLFRRHNVTIGQVLLTADDLEDRQRYVNIRNTLEALAHYRVVPIINENDSVGTDEIKVGDNDTLSAYIANLVSADLLVIMSDVDGFYSSDPRKSGDAKLLTTVKDIDEEMELSAGDAGTEVGVGGMRTKIEAARIVTTSGEMMLIANGKKHSLLDIVEGKELGTLFLPRSDRMAGRKWWIAFTLKKQGAVIVDQGAAEAIFNDGKSLLPSGIVGTERNFEIGDMVAIETLAGKEFARGLTNYSSKEIEKIKGLQSKEIENVLGYRYYDEVIHRDDLVLLSKGKDQV